LEHSFQNIYDILRSNLLKHANCVQELIFQKKIKNKLLKTYMIIILEQNVLHKLQYIYI